MKGVNDPTCTAGTRSGIHVTRVGVVSSLTSGPPVLPSPRVDPSLGRHPPDRYGRDLEVSHTTPVTTGSVGDNPCHVTERRTSEDTRGPQFQGLL